MKIIFFLIKFSLLLTVYEILFVLYFQSNLIVDDRMKFLFVCLFVMKKMFLWTPHRNAHDLHIDGLFCRNNELEIRAREWNTSIL